MGMSKSQIEMQLQMSTQKAIAELKQNMQYLDKMVRIIDSNMRQGYAMLVAETTRYSHTQSIHINFLINELKSKMSGPEIEKFEERFKVFAESENKKMKAQHDELIKKTKEAEEKKKLEDNGEKLVEN